MYAGTFEMVARFYRASSAAVRTSSGCSSAPVARELGQWRPRHGRRARALSIASLSGTHRGMKVTRTSRKQNKLNSVWEFNTITKRFYKGDAGGYSDPQSSQQSTKARQTTAVSTSSMQQGITPRA